MKPTPRLAGDPERHTLDVGPHPRFFGDLAEHTPHLEVTVQPVFVDEWKVERHPITERPPWDLYNDASVFAPRRRESDGKVGRCRLTRSNPS
jgi:hypothetical protein